MDTPKGLGRLKPLVAVLIILVIALSLPAIDVRRIRGAAAWAATPLWSEIISLKTDLSPEDAFKERVRQLELERTLLHQRLKETTALSALGAQTQGIKARVLAREPGAWNRFLWVDAGRETVGAESPLQKHSPVVFGDCVVGLVEYVGRRQSLVRLVTDPQCWIAVQVDSEGPQGISIASKRLSRLLRSTHQVEERLRRALQPLLMQLMQLSSSASSWKGFIRGAPETTCEGGALVGEFYPGELAQRTRSCSHEPADEPSERRQTDFKAASGQAPVAGQLLVTTGLDGLFPPGLKVAFMETVGSLAHTNKTDGPAIAFSALPAVDSLDELQWLTILQPAGFSSSDSPRPTWEEHLLPKLSD